MASADNLQQLAYVKIKHYEVGPGGVPDKSDEMDSLKSCKFNFNLSSQKSPFEKDDSVLVEWRDDWYKATVTKIYGKSVGKQKFRIHYDG